MDVIEKMKNSIQESFDHIRKALDFREKLLCRQVEVLQSSSKITNDLHFIPENEVNLLHLIRIFGKFNVNKFNVSSDFLSNEDYEEDPVLMSKQLVQTTAAVDDKAPPTPTLTISNSELAFKQFLLDQENGNQLNESLIKIMLKESKELIERSDAVMNRLEKKESLSRATKKGSANTKEGGRHGNKNKLQINGDTPAAAPSAMAPKSSSKNSSQTTSHHQSKRNNNTVVAESAKRGGTATNNSSSTAADKSTTQSSSSSSSSTVVATSSSTKKKFASLKNISNLTLNSGTLNLRNITNLTINTTCTNARPTAITNAAANTVAADYQAVACDFYNRLINENKLLQQHNRHNCCTNKAIARSQSHCETNVSPASSNGTTSTSFKEFSSGMERKLMEKMDNWNANEMLAVDANGNVVAAATPVAASERPKQIQHWLKQIINDSELEPMQNTELLEFSRIKST